MKFQRKFIIILLVFLFAKNQWADATLIYQDKTTEKLTPSVEYFEDLRFYSNQWIDSRGYIIELDDDKTEINALFNTDDITKALPLSSLTKQSSNTIGAINGDFFNYTSNTAIGPLINNNTIIYNGAIDDRFNIFGVNNLKRPFIMSPESFLPIIKIDNTPLKYSLFNKDFITEGEIVLLDDNFGMFSLGKESAYITEILIENETVKQIYYNEKAIKIPKGSYILSIPPEKKHLTSSLQVGDSITIETPKITEFIKTAIGGGSRLIKNGEIVDSFSLNIQGTHPRSAVGYSKENNEVIFLTVNGRNTNTPGVTQSDLATLMKELGASEAINLDGGGSSTLLKRSFGDESLKAVNYLSDGSERPIFNGLSIVSNYEAGPIDKLKLSVSNEQALLDVPIELSVKGTDAYFNPVDLPLEEVTFESTIDGIFSNEYFIPKSTGKGKIIVTYDSVSVEKNIEVHDDLAELKFSKEHIKTKNQDFMDLKPKVITQKGYEIPVPIKALSINLSNDLYEIKDGLIRFSDTLKDTRVALSYKNLSSEISINAQSYETKILDDFEALKGEHIVYPSNLSGKFNLFKNLNNDSLAGRLFYDFTKDPTKTRASYYDYFNNIPVDEDAKSISLDVFGYLGRNHWLRINVIDSKGITHNLTLARQVNWEGWKTVEVTIPSTIQGDFYINRIYLVETDFSKADTGLILMDNLAVKYPIQIDLVKTTHYPSIDSQMIDLHYQQDNLYITHDTKKIQSNNFALITRNQENLNTYNEQSLNTLTPYSRYSDGSKLLIKLNNTNKQLLNYEGSQWQFLLETLKTVKRRNLILYLEEVPRFKNQFEKELFYSKIKSYQLENASNVYIICEDNTFTNDYYKGIEIIHINPNESFSLQFNFFNDKSAYQLIK